MVQPLFSPNKPTRIVEATPHLRVAARTDTGHVRSHNEDAYGVVAIGSDALSKHQRSSERVVLGERGVLLTVSDGMGGAESGAVASAIVVERMKTGLVQALGNKPVAEAMREAVMGAHRAVRHASAARQQPEAVRMGATLTAAYVCKGEATIAQVGDSRAYLVRGGKITLLTHDQTMVQALVDGGVMNVEEVPTSPFRNLVLQAMGHEEEIEIAVSRLSLRDRDLLMLCSDGLTSVVSDREIERTLSASLPVAVAIDRLIDLTNVRGSPDNVTVVLAGVSGDFPPCDPTEPVASTVEVITPFVGKIRH